MANKLNKPICATSYGNTGYGDCYLEPKKIKGAFLVPLSFIITEENLADLQDFLNEKVLAAIGQRIFPMHDFVNLTDGTEDVQIETTDYGVKIPTRDGDYDLTFRYINGGVQLHQELQKNQGTGKAYLLYDEDGVIFGYRTKQGLKGIPGIVLVPAWRMASGSASATYNLRLIFASQYINKGNLGFIKQNDFNVFDVKGLQDVELQLVGLSSNVATVLAFTLISNVNMFTAFETNLEETSAWLAVDENGNDVPVTNVAANATADGSNGGWDITFSATEFNAADKVYLRWAPPATLADSPILVSGYDVSIPLEIEAPAS